MHVQKYVRNDYKTGNDLYGFNQMNTVRYYHTKDSINFVAI